MATPKSQQRRTSPSTPLSPSLLSRKGEKDQMINLNNRMAVYVEKVRSLENENEGLRIRVTSYEQTSSSEVSTMKAMYEGELSEARRLLDELSREKAQLQIEATSFQEKYEAERSRADGLQHDNDLLEKKLKDYMAMVSAKDAQYARVKRERDDFCAEVDNLKGKIVELKEDLESTQRMMEAETLQRVDFENKHQSIKEELLFKERLHNEEISEVRRRHTVSVAQISQQTKGDYDSKLEIAIFDLREQQSADLDQLREDLEAQYSLKLSDMTKQLDYSRRSNLKGQESSKVSEVKVERLQATIHSMQTQIAEGRDRQIMDLTKQNNDLSNRMRDLEGQIETERELRITCIMAVEKERDAAREMIAKMEKDHSELLSIKLQLDSEIAVYRKLLEEEEQRLHLSPGASGDSESKGRTRSRRKRKRVVAIEEQSKAKKQERSTTVYSETVTVERSQRRGGSGREDVLHQQALPNAEGSNSCMIM